MKDRLLFILSLILLLLPFVGVYLEWRVWVAFGVGVILFIYLIIYVVKK